MSQSEQKRETFVIRILDTQNATWQGTVSWTEEDRSVSFRSALELLRLIDGAVDKAPEQDRT